MFFLESERLLFREHQPGDMEAYCALESDPEVRRYVGGAPRPHEAAVSKFRNTFLKNASHKLALRTGPPLQRQWRGCPILAFFARVGTTEVGITEPASYCSSRPPQTRCGR